MKMAPNPKQAKELLDILNAPTSSETKDNKSSSIKCIFYVITSEYGRMFHLISMFSIWRQCQSASLIDSFFGFFFALPFFV